MLKEGQKAVNFSLPSNLGKDISLKDLAGKKVVLYFYPKDNTPGCTLEARDFQALKNEFEKNNTLILGISKDTIKSHNKFAEKEYLSFPLLSDENCSTCEAYGVWAEKSMCGKKYMGINRTTFLINEEGFIEKVWENVSVTCHATTILRYIMR
ncbi:MAG: thioredoxin-dependent thiol peroxidase [Candidatus Midichloria sp.]|nr:MAG: thioredoxin-dependent thiol peroxidase [Candidatus Midichloria sp.]